MSDEAKHGGFAEGFFVDPMERDPRHIARDAGRSSRVKRFYASAGIALAEAGFNVTLDGRPVKTPARKPLWAPNEVIAAALAAEWNGQGAEIDPATMPLTRMVNSALDGVAAQMAEVEADVAKYAESDLVCYRAADPDRLVVAQREAWDPYVAFARDLFGARLALIEGAMFQAQSAEALSALAAGVRAFVGAGEAAPLRLAGLHTMTTLTGSCVIALAAALRRASVEDAWRAAHVDEDFQIAAWGADAEAQARRAARFADMRAAAALAGA